MIQKNTNNLEFVTPHESIEHFESVKLDNFSIFTGKNGSGKTHLLNAIKSGRVKFNSILPNEIVYFNFETFKTENIPLKSPQNRSQVLDSSYNNFRNSLRSFGSFGSTQFTKDELKTIKKIVQDKNKPLLDVTIDDIEDSELWNKISRYHNFCTSIFSLNKIESNTIPIIKKSKNFADEITKDEITTNLIQMQTKQNLIPTQLGILFYDYQLNLYNKQDYVFKNSDKNASKEYIEETAVTQCNRLVAQLT